jgi:hypothetical protein
MLSMLSQVGPKRSNARRARRAARPRRAPGRELRPDPFELGQIAVDPVVQIERLAAPELDPGEDRGAIRDQQPAGLTLERAPHAVAADGPLDRLDEGGEAGSSPV